MKRATWPFLLIGYLFKSVLGYLHFIVLKIFHQLFISYNTAYYYIIFLKNTCLICRYGFLTQLNDIGSRTEKHWFAVKDYSIKTERLLTLVRPHLQIIN